MTSESSTLMSQHCGLFGNNQMGNPNVAIIDLKDNQQLSFGDAKDIAMRWDGTDLDVLPLANNAVWKWGNGTLSFDMWWYGSAAANYILFDASGNDLIFMDAMPAEMEL